MDKLQFQENLTEARKKRGYTQREVARAIGVSDKTYSKWETGENEPDIDALCRLGEFYGVSPALFFREGETAPELEGMPVEEAAESCFRRINDLLLGLRSVQYPVPGEERPLPVPEMPEELRLRDSRRNLWHYAYRDLLALIAAGTDANFTMLMLPHQEHYRWLTTEGEGLEALFRLLGMPGAVRCLYGMLTEKPGTLYSPAYLAEKAGVTEAEAEAFLAAAGPWELSDPHPFLRETGTETVYSSGLRVQLLGLLTLGRILLSQDTRRAEQRGLLVSGNGNVTIPEGGAV